MISDRRQGSLLNYEELVKCKKFDPCSFCFTYDTLQVSSAY